jgi:hypothetical protein
MLLDDALKKISTIELDHDHKPDGVSLILLLNIPVPIDTCMYYSFLPKCSIASMNINSDKLLATTPPSIKL